MAKAAGSDRYFDVLRSMSPSTRLQDAITQAEKSAKQSRRQTQAAARRAGRTAAKKATATKAKKATHK